MVSINDPFLKTFENCVKTFSEDGSKKLISGASQNDSVYNSVLNLWDILFLYQTICIKESS